MALYWLDSLTVRFQGGSITIWLNIIFLYLLWLHILSIWFSWVREWMSIYNRFIPIKQVVNILTSISLGVLANLLKEGNLLPERVMIQTIQLPNARKIGQDVSSQVFKINFFFKL